MEDKALKPMTYDDITVTQAKRLYPVVCRSHAFYARLLARMERRGFPRLDPYYTRVQEAEKHLHTVMIWTFYATVKQGVGTPERKE